METIQKNHVIREWDATNMSNGTLTLIIGPQGTGKSTIVKELCYQLRNKVDYAIGFSATESSMSEFIPASLIYNNFDEDVLQGLIDQQRSKCQDRDKLRALVVFDNMDHDKTLATCKAIRELFNSHRHLQITVIMTLQCFIDLLPDLRSKADYVFACHNNSIMQQKQLHTQFFGCFPKYKDFTYAMDKFTNNHNCLVGDFKTSHGYTVSGNVYWFKAPDSHETFKIGMKSSDKFNETWYPGALNRPPTRTVEDTIPRDNHNNRRRSCLEGTVFQDLKDSFVMSRSEAFCIGASLAAIVCVWFS